MLRKQSEIYRTSLPTIRRPEKHSNSRKSGDWISSNREVRPIPRNFHSVEIETGQLASTDIQEKESAFPLIDFKTQKGDPIELEKKLAMDFLQFRSKRPIGFIVRNLDFLALCLKTYRGIPPIKFTGRNEKGKVICEELGGLLI